MINKIVLAIPGYGEINPVGDVPTGGTDTVQNVIQFGTTFLLIAATLLSLAFIIFGGIKWTISGGDKTALEGARKMITYAIIGLVITFLSFFIINTIGDFFGVKLLGTPLCKLPGGQIVPCQ